MLIKKHIAVITTAEKLREQEHKMHNIMYSVSTLCDITTSWLQKGPQNIDPAAGHPIAEIYSLEDALLFGKMMGHVQSMERQVIFPDRSSLLITTRLIDALLVKAKEKDASFSSKKW